MFFGFPIYNLLFTIQPKTKIPNQTFRISIAGDKRAFDTGFKFASDTTQSSNVRSTALGIVAAYGKGDQRAFPLIFQSYKKSLDNNEYQSIFNNLGSLIRLADPRGQEAFDLARTKFKTQPQLMGYVTMFEAQFKAGLGK